MIKNIIFYFVLLSSLLCILLFTTEWSFFILLSVVAFFPVLSFLISLPYMIVTIKRNIFLYSKKIIKNNDEFSVEILGSGKTYFTYISAKVLFVNRYGKVTETKIINYVGNLRNPVSVKCDIPIKCGIYNAYIISCRVYDLLGFFSMKLNINNKINTLVVPNKKPYFNNYDVENYLLRDINERKDIDYFNFQEYQYGMNAKNINWKLSVRKDKLISKNYDKSHNELKLIVLDLRGDYIHDEDVLSEFFFIADKAIEENINFIVKANDICMLIDNKEKIKNFYTSLYLNQNVTEYDAENIYDFFTLTTARGEVY